MGIHPWVNLWVSAAAHRRCGLYGRLLIAGVLVVDTRLPFVAAPHKAHGGQRPDAYRRRGYAGTRRPIRELPHRVVRAAPILGETGNRPR